MCALAAVQASAFIGLPRHGHGHLPHTPVFSAFMIDIRQRLPCCHNVMAVCILAHDFGAHFLDALQAFDDCTTIASIFKLLDSFEGLLDRGVIATDLERKHLDLVRNYGQDLKEVADTFRETKDSPPLNKNAAPHSGRVTWVRGLRERVAGDHMHSDHPACCS